MPDLLPVLCVLVGLLTASNLWLWVEHHRHVAHYGAILIAHRQEIERLKGAARVSLTPLQSAQPAGSQWRKRKGRS